MTKETKIGLFIGMGVIILIGVVVSDHLSESLKPLEAPPYSELFKEPPVATTAQGPANSPSGAAASKKNAPPLAVPGHTSTSSGVQGQTPVASHKPDTIILDLNKPREARAVIPGDQPLGGGAFVPVEGPKAITPKEVERINSLADRLRIGDASLKPQGAASGVDVSGPRYHIVAEGDTLSSLARQYYGRTADAKAIHSANLAVVPNPDRLKVGTKLLIPIREGEKQASAAGGKPASAANEYTIQEGDTLGDIADRFLGSSSRWEEIMDVNKDRITSPRSLRVGTVIRLPRR